MQIAGNGSVGHRWGVGAGGGDRPPAPRRRGDLVTILDRDEAKAKALAAELGGKSGYAVTDVTDPEQAAAAVAQAASAGPPLRIAVNCAGIGWVGR